MARSSSCIKCPSKDLLVVSLVPKDQPMLFHTCRDCESTWWASAEDGADVHLDNVIEQMAS